MAPSELRDRAPEARTRNARVVRIAPVARSAHAGRVCLASLLALVAVFAGCGDEEPGFMSPGPGDFVQLVQPADGGTISADEFARRSVAIVLNFAAAESYTFSSLRSFRYDGDEVRDQVDRVDEGDPLFRVSFSFQPDEAEEGSHEVEVVYADTRGTLHRIRWNFRVQG